MLTVIVRPIAMVLVRMGGISMGHVAMVSMIPVLGFRRSIEMHRIIVSRPGQHDPHALGLCNPRVLHVFFARWL